MPNAGALVSSTYGLSATSGEQDSNLRPSGYEQWLKDREVGIRENTINCRLPSIEPITLGFVTLSSHAMGETQPAAIATSSETPMLAPMSTHYGLTGLATRAAAALGKLDEVDAVHLYGSVARGDPTPISDIDLLIVVRSPHAARTVAVEYKSWRVSPITFNVQPWSSLNGPEADWLFVRHLFSEGVTLQGDSARLHEHLRREQPNDLAVVSDIRQHFHYLARFNDLAPYQDRFFFSAAHLYRVAKSAVMLGNARKGIYDFDRSRAFLHFAHWDPDIANNLDYLRELEPFYLEATGRSLQRSSPSPSSAVIQRCVEAARSVIAAASS